MYIYIYKMLATIIVETSRTVKTKTGARPLNFLPGRRDPGPPGSPKKYLRGPDLVTRNETRVLKMVPRTMLTGRVRR